MPRLVRQHAVQAGVAAGASVLAVAAVLAVRHAPPPPKPKPVATAAKRPSTPSSGVFAGTQPLLPLPPGVLTRYAGRRVTGKSVTVGLVPVRDGFWVGQGDDRLWVEVLRNPGHLTRVHPGERVNFTGTLKPNLADYADDVGLTPATGSARLTREGVHVAVLAGTVMPG